MANKIVDYYKQLYNDYYQAALDFGQTDLVRYGNQLEDINAAQDVAQQELAKLYGLPPKFALYAIPGDELEMQQAAAAMTVNDRFGKISDKMAVRMPQGVVWLGFQNPSQAVNKAEIGRAHV